jgi:hypothetical protein
VGSRKWYLMLNIIKSLSSILLRFMNTTFWVGEARITHQVKTGIDDECY